MPQSSWLPTGPTWICCTSSCLMKFPTMSLLDGAIFWNHPSITVKQNVLQKMEDFQSFEQCSSQIWVKQSFFNIFNCFLGKKILTNHHHMISKKYLNMITYSPNRCVISAICYILVIVGIQINNRLDSKERHESCQFAFERQSEGIDLNPRVMTWKNLLKGSQINLIEDLPCRSLLLPAVLASLGNIVICLLQVFLQPSQSHFKFLEIQVISSL